MFVCVSVCVFVLCTCESWGLSISLVESDHLAEGFGDSYCLFRTPTFVFMPCLRCPRHSPGSPLTPQETPWNGWEMTDGLSGSMDGTKESVQKGSLKNSKRKKKALLSVGQTKQTHIIILLGKDPNQYLDAIKSRWFDVCCCSAPGLITHHRSWGVSVCRNIGCDGVKQQLMVRLVWWFIDRGLSHIFVWLTLVSW